jgi:hypothetical protein
MDNIINKISNPEYITTVSLKYPEMNPRVLLSSILVSELKTSPSLENLAFSLKSHIESFQHISPQMYDDYHTKLNKWKKNDKKTMITQMITMKQSLENTKLHPKNPDDWNTCIDSSIDLLNDSISKINQFS